MSAPIGNVLALFHDGHYLAEIAGGGIRVGKQLGASVDFQADSNMAVSLQAAYASESMESLHAKVIDAMPILRKSA